MEKTTKSNARLMVPGPTMDRVKEMSAFYRVPFWDVVTRAVNALYKGEYDARRQAYMERVEFDRFVEDNSR